MNYRFQAKDYIIFLLSYVFFFLYIADAWALLVIPVITDIPSWIYLVIAVALNVWALPLPGIHPRLPKPTEVEALPYPREAPALPGKPAELQKKGPT